MNATIEHKGKTYAIDLSQPIDISILLKEDIEAVNAFHAPPLHVSPVKAGDFIGDTRQGGLLNFKNIFFNPHGNGTHTECVAHISSLDWTIQQALRQYFFLAEVISLYPIKQANGDRVVMAAQLDEIFENRKLPSALIMRTLPNDIGKNTRNYSGTNPPYLHHEAAQWMVDQGVQHLLLDLPSVDREEDEGKLLAHKAFWQYPTQPRKEATITELIYVPDSVKDALYILNIQMTSLALDVSPSKPVLYEIK